MAAGGEQLGLETMTGLIGGKDRKGLGRTKGSKNICPTHHHCPNSLVWVSAQVLPMSADVQSDFLHSPFTEASRRIFVMLLSLHLSPAYSFMAPHCLQYKSKLLVWAFCSEHSGSISSNLHSYRLSLFVSFPDCGLFSPRRFFLSCKAG